MEKKSVKNKSLYSRAGMGAVAWAYLKKIHRSLGAWLLMLGIFAMVYSLYSLNWEPYVYGAVLCSCAGLLFLILGFFLYVKHYRELEAALSLLDLEEMPVPEGRAEAVYQEMIRRLSKERLRLASKLEGNYSEMIDFYTMWVHQIKTPIAAMRLLLQSGEKESDPQMDMELFKIEQYVEMVLGYLRMDNMSGDLRIARYNLDAIIRQSVKKYARMFIMKKITLEYESLECQVLTDEKWLSFVLEQLLSNALKYTKQGKISIYMEKGREKTLVIEDTGIGILEEDLPRVFEKGFTGYNGRQDKKSTGIGLYLVKKILTRLSHTVRLESVMGKGTRVLVDLADHRLELM